jgi:hypothetical protein
MVIMAPKAVGARWSMHKRDASVLVLARRVGRAEGDYSLRLWCRAP